MTLSAWTTWAADRDPLVATVSILRLVVLCLAWYLVGAIGIGLAARSLRAVRLVRVVDALTVPMIRRLLQRTVGLTMVTAVVAASSPAGSDTRSPYDVAITPAASVVELTPGPTVQSANHGAATDVGSRRPRLDGGRLTLDGPDPPRSPASAPGASTQGPGLTDRDAGPGVVGQPDADRGPAVHEVRAGDSFWSMAAATLAAAKGREPTDAEVASYWRTLIAANRDRLVVGDDPDLIFPGQRFVLPAIGDEVGHGEHGS